MALCNALMIKKNCKINDVALVTNGGSIAYLRSITDAKVIEKAFDHIILDEIDTQIAMDRKYNDTRYTNFVDSYHNLNRASAYDHSPFDQTLLLDADYLMLDDSMDKVWDTVEDFLCNRNTLTLNHQTNTFGSNNRFNTISIPLYWATAVFFKRSSKAEIVFKLINFIKENYEYYHYLYEFKHDGYFRNDFALSIAIHMCDNFMEYGSIKPLPTEHILVAMEHDEMHAFSNGACIITSEPDQGDFRLHKVENNVHVMNKRSILRHQKDIINYANS